jgi:predicted DNA-binding protein (MmcQ/YjbR family)
MRMDDLAAFCLSLPEAYEDHPWGETVFKVRKKIFVFLGLPEKGLNVTVKLPQSGWPALQLPFVKATGYNLGKSGWVTASFAEGEEVPYDLLKAWIIESYRAVAPKRLGQTVGVGVKESGWVETEGPT